MDSSLDSAALKCPHCRTSVERGATVCPDCEAEIVYGASRSEVFWLALVAAILAASVAWVGSAAVVVVLVPPRLLGPLAIAYVPIMLAATVGAGVIACRKARRYAKFRREGQIRFLRGYRYR